MKTAFFKKFMSIVLVFALCASFVFCLGVDAYADTFDITVPYYPNMRYSRSSHAWQSSEGHTALIIPVNFYSNTRHVVTLSGLTYYPGSNIFTGATINHFDGVLSGFSVNSAGDEITLPVNVGDSSIKFIIIYAVTPISFDNARVQLDGVDCNLVLFGTGVNGGAINNNGFLGFTTDIKILDNLSVNGLDYISRFEKFTDTLSMLSYVLDFTEDIPATYLDMVVRVNNGSISEASIGSWTDTQGWIGLTVDSITRDINSTGYCSYYRIYGEVESGFWTKECHLQFNGSFNDSDLQIISMNLFNDSIAPSPFSVNGFITFNSVDYSSSGSNMGWNLAGINPAEDFSFVLKANERWKEMDYLIFDFSATCTSLDSLFVYMDDGSGGISLLPFENRLVSGFSAADGSTNKLFRVIVDLTNVNRTVDSDIVLSLGGKIYEGGLSFQLLNSYGYVVSSPTDPELSWLRKIWNSLTGGFNRVVDTLVNGFNSVVEALEEFFVGSEGGFDSSGSDFSSSSDDIVSAGDQVSSSLDGGMTSLEGMVSSSSFTGTLTTLGALSNAIFVGHEIEICGIRGNPFTILVSLFSVAVLLPLGLKFIFRKWGSKGSGG